MDIGIRLALGARRDRVVADVLASGLRLAVIGIAIGVVASFALSKAIAGFLAGVSPHDASSLILSAVVVMLIAVAACLVPAPRASAPTASTRPARSAAPRPAATGRTVTPTGRRPRLAAARAEPPARQRSRAC